MGLQREAELAIHETAYTSKQNEIATKENHNLWNCLHKQTKLNHNKGKNFPIFGAMFKI